jgi:tetratricopeptide (TPR) repeat protein
MRSNNRSRSKRQLIFAATCLLATDQSTVVQAAEHPRKASDFLQLGQMLEYNGNFDAAISAYQKAAALAPKLVEPHQSLARLYAKTGHLQSAIDEYTSIGEGADHDPAASLDLATTLRSAGRAKESVLILQSICRKPHQGLDPERELGFALLEAGEYLEAAKQFKRLITQKPEQTSDYLGLAIAQFHNGEPISAEESIKRVLQTNPNDANAYCLLGDLEKASSNRLKAVVHYQQAISIAPTLQQAYLSLGNLYLEDGRLDQSAQIFEQAIRTCPPSADIYLGLAVNREKQGDLKKAIQLYERAFTLETNQEQRESIHAKLKELQSQR